jgi:hypothetical protein
MRVTGQAVVAREPTRRAFAQTADLAMGGASGGEVASSKQGTTERGSEG